MHGGKLLENRARLALVFSLILALAAAIASATNAHLHPHSQFQQAQSGHLHDNTHRQGAGQHQDHVQLEQQQQQQQQHHQQDDQPQAQMQQSRGLGAGKIIAPLATGALMGAALTAGGDPNRRHTQATDPEKIIVDLSHPLHNGTLHWPKFKDFQYTIMTDGERKSPNNESYYLKSDSINTAIHSGTHLDAPLHFSKDGWSVEKIPLQRLIDVPVTVIDVSNKVAANRTYNFVKADFIDAKTNESLVRPKSVVLVYTAISELYDQGEQAYSGTDTRNVSEMKIPGFSSEAAQYLVEQEVYGVGLDSLSADSSDRHGSGDSYDPVAHVIFNKNNVYILENVSSKLKELVNAPAARLTIAPLPIVDGSGSPVRLVAIIGHDECHCHAHNSAPESRRHIHSSLSMIVTLLLCLIVLLL